MGSFKFNSQRSTVYARNGMVAASQPLAAQAGLRTLQQGGNAIDAAIATIATLTVVEPCMTGIGGDAFALIWSAKEQKLYGLNGSGPAARALNAADLRAEGLTEMPARSGLSVTVPGSLRAWQLALDKFGTIGLDGLLATPIEYASKGFPVSPIIAKQWRAAAEGYMSRLPDSKRVFTFDGRGPNAGEIFANPEYAETLRTIARDGYDAFYTGNIAEQIVEAVRADGGLLELDDLKNYMAEWVDPISADYTNHKNETYTFHEIPPNGQGLTALMALNMVQNADLHGMGWHSAEYWHTLIEAIKLAFVDAHAYIADPRVSTIPLAGMLSQSYAKERYGLITPEQAALPAAGNPSLHGETVYLTTSDAEGNMVSWIQSMYMGFGSGVTAGTTGVHLQNRGANFSLEEGHPNEAAGGKRPFHTIIPCFITKGGQPFSSFGVMGGFMQPQGHLQVGLNMIEFGMDAQTALDAPRFYWQKDRVVGIESALDADIRAALTSYGHEIHPDSDKMHYGGGQVINRDAASGVYSGGTEPRKDGTVAAS